MVFSVPFETYKCHFVWYLHSAANIQPNIQYFKLPHLPSSSASWLSNASVFLNLVFIHQPCAYNINYIVKKCEDFKANAFDDMEVSEFEEGMINGLPSKKSTVRVWSLARCDVRR